MTTLLTRLYANETVAHDAMDRLFRAGFPRHVMRVIAARANEGRDGAMARIARSRVPERAASVYAEGVASGNALLVVAATYKPLGARKIGVKVLEGTDDLPTNLEQQDFKVATERDHAPRVLKDHPRFLTPSPDPDHVGGPLSDQFGFSMVSAMRRRTSATEGGGHILPFGNLMTRRSANSAMKGGGFMSRAFWPMKLITNKPRRSSVIRGGGTPFSRLFGLRTTS